MTPFAGVTPIGATTTKDDFPRHAKKLRYVDGASESQEQKFLLCLQKETLQGDTGLDVVQDTYQNWMTPDPWAGSEYNNVDTTKKLPVGEYNKRLSSGLGTNPSNYQKPVNTDFYTILGRQGLVDDDIRGSANSSGRRNIPSSVFGFSTPGPRDKREGAPQSAVGTSDARTQTFTSILGGSSFVMDDGDERYLRNSAAASDAMVYTDVIADPQATTGIKTIPKGECVRLRTRTGHQILMHNSEDLIYIGNAKGTSWIEMTANGKIDIFAQDSISIRTQVDLNISADRDINMTAARDINYNAGRDYKLTVGQNSDYKVGANHNMEIGADENHYVGASQKIFVGATGDLVVTGAHTITNSATLDINTTGAHTESNAATLDINTTGARKDSQASLDLNSGGHNRLTAGGLTEVASSGNILQSAPNIHLNGPAATSADPAGCSKLSSNSRCSSSSTLASACSSTRAVERTRTFRSWNICSKSYSSKRLTKSCTTRICSASQH